MIPMIIPLLLMALITVLGTTEQFILIFEGRITTLCKFTRILGLMVLVCDILRAFWLNSTKV